MIRLQITLSTNLFILLLLPILNQILKLFAFDRITLTVVRNDDLILIVPNIPAENESGVRVSTRAFSRLLQQTIIMIKLKFVVFISWFFCRKFFVLMLMMKKLNLKMNDFN